jgi:signal transduction histidine kinase
MEAFTLASALTPFPIVEVRNPGPPRSGLVVSAPDECQKHFARGDQCAQHYRSLVTGPRDQAVPCPFGFSSLMPSGEKATFVLTGFIPFPRAGGKKERDAAKRNSGNRLPLSAIQNSALFLLGLGDRLRKLEDEALRNYSMALHEIRKLNRTVKQTAERLCREDSPSDPEAASSELVRIWKTSSLMSQQFDIVEILANENLAGLPLKHSTAIYALFDKCVRIFQPQDGQRRIVISSSPGGYSPFIDACEKTIPIIPTVLIENALKYAAKGSEVAVSLRREGADCVVEVTNLSHPNPNLTERVFERGVRVSADKEGSGNGLYVAQLVAKQHHSQIHLRTASIARDRMRCTFSLKFRAIP